MKVDRLKNEKILSVLLLFVLSVVWGSSFILIKKGLVAFNPGQVGTIRILFACLFLLPVALKHLKTVYKFQWKRILLLGLIANLIPAVLFAVAETKLSSSITGILNSLTPIFTLLIGLFFFQTHVKRYQFLGLVVAFAGSAVLSLTGSDGSFGSVNFFVFFVIVATVCYGLSSNMIRHYFQDMRPVVLTSLAMFSIGPIAAVYLFSSDFLFRLTQTGDGWSSFGFLAILGIVGTAIALAFFNKLIQLTSAVFASTVTYLIPIAAVMWGLIDGEVLYPVHFLGMVLIILGIYIINKV